MAKKPAQPDYFETMRKSKDDMEAEPENAAAEPVEAESVLPDGIKLPEGAAETLYKFNKTFPEGEGAAEDVKPLVDALSLSEADAKKLYETAKDDPDYEDLSPQELADVLKDDYWKLSALQRTAGIGEDTGEDMGMGTDGGTGMGKGTGMDKGTGMEPPASSPKMP